MDTKLINKWFTGIPTVIQKPHKLQGLRTVEVNFSSEAIKEDFLQSHDWCGLVWGYGATVKKNEGCTMVISVSGSCD